MGLFDVPVTVEITTANGRHDVSHRSQHEPSESFSFPADGASAYGAFR